MFRHCYHLKSLHQNVTKTNSNNQFTINLKSIVMSIVKFVIKVIKYMKYKVVLSIER